ncbi:MAG: hypothetical protein QME05_02015 [Candidatus Margulisbacteria bacterium]|nr:hypothetical protein [Candidatus Margulisiibacteriota bacterium]
MSKLSDLPSKVLEDAAQVGIGPSEKERSGSFFQIDHNIICSQSSQEGIEVLETAKALVQYPWFKDYCWKAVDPNKDEFTKAVRDAPPRGYFLRALPGAETIFPLQACLFIGKEGLSQKVHNVIIAEEGAHLHIITGCAGLLSITTFVCSR